MMINMLLTSNPWSDQYHIFVHITW